ncbi:GNAT family N-acetyltransferase [Haloarcula salinisoli]|uniref:GNAT family N-acetyltransferase n=1 Tax=Haloarcula salinisoli TaxID=2487746 RepID=A0A8J7YB48_9EURY|nr:GNAT family N-acetyltransferase [Halomicroarcula salinisoli]MBX0285707.1 GNAT family N-acetyltransferase [Halomicroarcula salinisoli]MBX0302805.1 GNAT family N-acetyltransferase [Halomicroarcula salinisoli]
MEFALLGWPDDEHPLRLDYREFAYAGKFVMTSTGKAVVGDDGVVAAAAFDDDRTDSDTLCIRYITVRRDRQGEGLGPRLLRFVRERARERGYERVTIAANNPYSYEASYRAGFCFTGEEAGIAELTLEWPGDRSTERYQSGLSVFSERDLSADEGAFLAAKLDSEPPAVVDPPG